MFVIHGKRSGGFLLHYLDGRFAVRFQTMAWRMLMVQNSCSQIAASMAIVRLGRGHGCLTEAYQ
jgi:hypothetical protein